MNEWKDITITQQPDGFFTVAFVGGEWIDNLCLDEIFCAVAHMLVAGKIPYGKSTKLLEMPLVTTLT